MSNFLTETGTAVLGPWSSHVCERQRVTSNRGMLAIAPSGFFASQVVPTERPPTVPSTPLPVHFHVDPSLYLRRVGAAVSHEVRGRAHSRSTSRDRSRSRRIATVSRLNTHDTDTHTHDELEHPCKHGKDVHPYIIFKRAHGENCTGGERRRATGHVIGSLTIIRDRNPTH